MDRDSNDVLFLGDEKSLNVVNFKNGRLMEIIWFVGIGAVAGWLAGLVLKNGSFGVIGNIIIGVIGAFIGRWAFDQLRISMGLNYRLEQLIIAFVGALILVLVLGQVKRLK